ncbi:MAG: hypothetical protein GEU26_01205 [Nitrososphaeraceae archaeon]|nr:hypothetical protein [Nitrososphaeraceae archaeon]
MATNELALSSSIRQGCGDRREGIEIQCKRCHHSWTYKGKNDYVVCCPHCGTKIGIKKLLTAAPTAAPTAAAVGGLDTYEAILDNVHFPALGSSEDDARQCLQSWLDKFTEGYKLRRFYLKKRSAKEEAV